MIVFIDEYKIIIHGADDRMRVWRRTYEILDPANINQPDRYGVGNVLVCGAVFHTQREVRT